MEASFEIEENCYYKNRDGVEIGPIYLKYPKDSNGYIFGVDQLYYSGVKYRKDGSRNGPYRLGDLFEKTRTNITIGSTWYWQGEKDSPVTVIGFDSKGRVVVESEFEFQSSDENYEKGSVFKIESEFTDCYTNTPKAKKLTGFVRVLKPAEGYLVNDKSEKLIFQSAVFSDEAKARAAVPYGFEVVDLVKVEWSEE